MGSKLLTIFVFYDKEGKLKRYIKHYIESLSKISDYLCIVVNGEVLDTTLKQLDELSDKVIVRENRGFDIWGYREGIISLIDVIQESDRLLLTNGTCFGPVFPLENVFAVMDERKCDFWGLTKHPEQNNYLLPNERGYIYEHIQTFFMVINNNMLHDPRFLEYWENLPMFNTKNEAVALHEVYFTKHFEDMGFSSDSYINVNDFEGRVNNPYVFIPDELLSKYRMPLVKVQSFAFPFYQNIVANSAGDHSRLLMEQIREETDYDESFIWEELLADYPLSRLRSNMHLYDVINTRMVSVNKDEVIGKRILFLIYLNDNIDISTLYGMLNHYGEQARIHLFSNKKFGNKQEYKQLQLLCSCQFHLLDRSDNIAFRMIYAVNREEIQDADYIFYYGSFHKQDSNLSFKEEDKNNKILNTLLSLNSYNRIVNLFQSQPNLGLINTQTWYSASDYNDKKNLFLMYRQYYKQISEDLFLAMPFDDQDYDLNYEAGWMKKESATYLYDYLKKPTILDTLMQVNYSDLYFIPRLLQTGYYYPIELRDELYSNLAFDNFRYQANINQTSNGYTPLYAFSSRNEMISSPYRFREIIKIVLKYPKHKFKSMIRNSRLKGKIKSFVNINRHQKTQEVHASAGDILLGNVSVENNRLVLYFPVFPKEKMGIYLSLKNKKYYPLPDNKLDQRKKELVDYQREQGLNSVFFVLPIETVIDNEPISLIDMRNNRFIIHWVGGFSFNALELKEKNIYTYLENGNIRIQTKKEFIKSVYRSRYFSLKDKILFFACRMNPFHNISVFSENWGAADNSYQLFLKALENKEHAVFVANKSIIDKEDKPYIKKHMVSPNSFKHIIAVILSKRWITSFPLRNECLPIRGLKDIHYYLLPCEWDFVPHGITLPDKIAKMVIKYNWENPTRTYVCSEQEKSVFENVFGFKNVKCLGAPRMDKWFHQDALDDNSIVMFFTWRLYMRNQKSFNKNDPYFVHISECVNTITSYYPSKTIYYVFHHEVTRSGADKVIKNILGNKNIVYVYLDNLDDINVFNSSFRNAKYLITDMSSVAYDFAYKEKSIPIYYQPDGFLDNHYDIDESLFDQLHLGLIVKNNEELVRGLSLNDLPKELNNRKSSFFSYQDGNNCERVLTDIVTTKPAVINSIEPKNNIEQSRLVILFFYDKDGVVDDYVSYYLSQLKKEASELCFVSNGPITDDSMNKVSSIVDRIIIRDNTGFDSAAYKEGILSYGYKYIADHFSELILCNHTVFGPVHPLSEMLSIMENRDCDMWGHAMWACNIGEEYRLRNNLLNNHVMSYFTAFKSRILKSQDFVEYWESLKLPEKYTDAVEFHENRCTPFFQKRGYIIDAYMDQKYLSNSIVFDGYEQLVDYRSPFVKRRVFFKNDDGSYKYKMAKGNQNQLLKYLESNTDYDVNLIIDNLKRTGVW